MNRGHVLESSPVQQMMAGNHNLWNINSPMRPPSHQSSPFFPPGFLPQYTIPTSSSSSLSMPSWHENQEVPESWSQLLLNGVPADENKASMDHFQPKKYENNWEEQLIHQGSNTSIVNVKQENSASSYRYGRASDEFQAVKSTWSQMMPVSSPQSCVTSLSSSMLDFSGNKAGVKHPHPDRSSECNSTATGGATKKAKVQSSSQSTFKVRKEKLGDRITALHQLVSPFGKTDTASVLLEAIGYIRFLQSQIEALSLPYLTSGSGNMRQQQQSVQGDRNCIFPEEPGQLLNDSSLKQKGVSQQDGLEEPKKDLRSRGLCLVPVSCTLQVGSDNGADYWAPAFGGGFRQM